MKPIRIQDPAIMTAGCGPVVTPDSRLKARGRRPDREEDTTRPVSARKAAVK